MSSTAQRLVFCLAFWHTWAQPSPSGWSEECELFGDHGLEADVGNVLANQGGMLGADDGVRGFGDALVDLDDLFVGFGDDGLDDEVACWLDDEASCVRIFLTSQTIDPTRADLAALAREALGRVEALKDDVVDAASQIQCALAAGDMPHNVFADDFAALLHGMAKGNALLLGAEGASLAALAALEESGTSALRLRRARHRKAAPKRKARGRLVERSAKRRA